VGNKQWERRKLADRRKRGNRRKDIGKARKWMGFERRKDYRRFSDVEQAAEERSPVGAKKD